MKPTDTDTDSSLDSLLHAGATGSTIDPQQAAELFAGTGWNICGEPVRLLTLSDLLIHTRIGNSYVVGTAPGQEPPDFAARLFDAGAIWFVARCRTSLDALSRSRDAEAFRREVETFLASKTADTELSVLIDDVLRYLSEGGKTRVSASAPPLPPGSKTSVGND